MHGDEKSFIFQENSSVSNAISFDIKKSYNLQMRLAILTKYDQQMQPLHAKVRALVLQLAAYHDVFFGPQTPSSMYEALGWNSDDAATRTASLRTLAPTMDAVVSIGGDGTMLGAAREVVPFHVPLIGVNQGRLGFITDIPLDEHTFERIQAILSGARVVEQRSLLRLQGCLALNDIVIQRESSKMLELEVSIDHRFAYRCRADGLLISTPTGSTAYNLSAGGSIVAPSAQVFVVTPVMPQSLSNRPLIVGDSATMQVKILAHPALVLADGLEVLHAQPGVILDIQKNPECAVFWHSATQYDYLETLRTKLGWHGDGTP